ncbi:glycosyl hydrolase catalytic core-domain-containing protein [Usnea florida]
MFFTSQSILFALSAFFAATEAQPHRHSHQHGTSKRASGVVTGRGIVYADGNTGMGALAPKLDWSTDWTAWQDNPDNNDLGTFVPQVWGLDYNNGNPQDQFLSAFLKAASGFNKGSTILGFNEPEQLGQSWMTPQTAVENWGGIDALKQSIGAKICTPCPSNGAQTGTSGTGTVTLQYQSGIDQGSQWMSEFLAAAKGKYTFDCLCMHWYGGASNSLAQDQTMIDQQVKDMVSLASQYNINDIVVAEMQRENADQEVRPSSSWVPCHEQLAYALAVRC